MSYYVIYDQKTGKVLQTHTSYVMGSDTPVEGDMTEILALASQEFGEGYDLRVAEAPKGFDPRRRTERLAVEVASNTVKVVPAPRPKKRG